MEGIAVEALVQPLDQKDHEIELIVTFRLVDFLGSREVRVRGFEGLDLLSSKMKDAIQTNGLMPQLRHRAVQTSFAKSWHSGTSPLLRDLNCATSTNINF